jgi:hypothetical protein
MGRTRLTRSDHPLRLCDMFVPAIVKAGEATRWMARCSASWLLRDHDRCNPAANH